MASRIFKQQTLQKVVHDKTLDGDGTPQAPLGVASGAFLTASSNVTITGNWTFTQPITVPVGSIPIDRLEDIGANTVLCRPSGSSGPILQQPLGTNSVLARGNFGTIISLASPISTVLRRLANGVFGFGQLETGHLGDATVTLAKLAADVGALTSITTNTNGTSIRFQLGSLGVQLCHHSLNLGSRVTFGAGTYASPWRSDTTNWTFPQAFDSAPHFAGVGIIDDSSAQTRANSVFARSVSSAGVAVIQSVACSSNATDVDAIAHVWAIGTWTP